MCADINADWITKEQAFTFRCHLIAGTFHKVTHGAGSGNRISNSSCGDGVHETRLPRIWKYTVGNRGIN